MVSVAADADTSSRDDELFDFPARDKSGKIEQIAVYRLLKSPLKALCRDFKLRTSGTKSTLQETLIKFSLNRDMWTLLQPGRHQPHKGPRPQNPGTTKPKKLKGYRKRQQEMFGDVGTSQEPVSNRENEENIELLALADALPQRCPAYYKPRPPKKDPEPNRKYVGNQQLAQDISTMQTTVNFIASVIVQNPAVMSFVAPSISAATTNISTSGSQAGIVTPPMSSLPTLPFTHSYLPSLPHIPPSSPQHESGIPLMTPLGLSGSNDHSAMDIQPLDQDMNSLPPMFANVRVQRLCLARGKVLEYTRNDVPDRPAVRFSKNLSRLRRIWDDERTDEFTPKDCPLKVKGVPIALKYWNELYSHECHDKSDKRWKGYKGQWFEWKCVAEYLLARTMDEFWAEFTNPTTGKRMSYTAIRKELRQRRIAQNIDGEDEPMFDVDGGDEEEDD